MNTIATLTDAQLDRHCFACETTYRVRQDGCTDPLAMMDCGHYYCRQCILDTDECHLCGYVTKNKFYVRRNQVWRVAPVIKKCVLPNTKLLSYELICLLVRFNNLTTTNFIAYRCCVLDPPSRQNPHSRLCPYSHLRPFRFVPPLPYVPPLMLNSQPSTSSQNQPSTSTSTSTSSQKLCNCVAGSCLCVVGYSNNSGRATKRASSSSVQLHATHMLQYINDKNQTDVSLPNTIVIDDDDDDDECVIVKKRKTHTRTATVTNYNNDSDSDYDDDNRAPPPNPAVVNTITKCMKNNAENLARMQSVSIEMKTCVENFLALHPQYDTRRLYQFVYDRLHYQSNTDTILYDLFVVLLLFDVNPKINVDTELQNVVDLIKENGQKKHYTLKYFKSYDDVVVDNNDKCVDITND